jgi:hypothetical protein
MGFKGSQSSWRATMDPALATSLVRSTLDGFGNLYPSFGCTGGLALATMAGESGEDGMKCYIRNRERREVEHFREIILFSEFVR